ncbi:MAG: tetratricopeptide repeat protein, partial [Silvibacterium sp.]
SGQIQSLNDSVDEMKTRITQVNKTLQDLQSQIQTIQTPPAAAQPATQQGTQQQGPADQNGQPMQPGDNSQNSGQQPMQQQPQAPPVDQLYQSAVRDYNSARYDLAAGEFSEVIQYYPQDNLAAGSQFYLGEISFRKGDFPSAIKNYDQVLEQFPGSSKAPAAQLRKGEAELRADRRDAAIRDFRSLIQRYPQTPEAQQARSHLNAMGVRITPTKPSAYPQQNH